MTQAFRNMRTSISGQPRSGRNSCVPAVELIHPILVSTKYARRLKVAFFAYHYYASIGREHTPSNMNNTHVLKDFYTEYEAVLDLQDEDKPNIPMFQKNLTPLK